ncbi:MAG: apolipoprotein N-acyltransferase [Verrucomicrobiota bacterium]
MPSFQERMEAHRAEKRRNAWWKQPGHPCYAVVTAFASAIALIFSFPPFDGAELAFVSLIPWVLWASFAPGWRGWWIAVGASQLFVWCSLLVWLRHVAIYAEAPLPAFTGPLIVLGLAATVAVLHLPFFGLLRWAVPKSLKKSGTVRVLSLLMLAGLWVIQEWVRTWFLTGFPWLPMATTQWRNPVALQLASITGAYGVSALIVAINIGIALYARQLIKRRKKAGYFGNICPEFYVVMVALFGSLVLYLRVLPQSEDLQPLFSASAIQPAISQEVKWDEEMALQHLKTIDRETRLAALTQPEIILWPESATPWEARGKNGIEWWIARLSAEIDTPILMGNLIETESGEWYNGIFWVTPEGGLDDRYYAKRKRVPFGEYVPMRGLFPFLDKAIPAEYDITAGDSARPLRIDVNGREVRIGGLVCYEDIFGHLARETALSGVDAFLVVTNNAWYGREGAAYQHAAHSVLRAVETGRPVVRVGNEGWSGWIDGQGRIRTEFTDANGSIYTRGSSPMSIFHDADRSRYQTFYVRYGDWFVWTCMALVVLGILILKWVPDRKEPEAKEEPLLKGRDNIFKRRRRLKGLE